MARIPGRKSKKNLKSRPKEERSDENKEAVYSEGIVSFTESLHGSRTLRDFGTRWQNTGFGLRDGLGLTWQPFNELSNSHGHSVCFDILAEQGFFGGGFMPVQRLRQEIKGALTAPDWKLVEEHLRLIIKEYDDSNKAPPAIGHRDHEIPHLQEAFLVALWAQLFCKPLSETWLAAMAYHACHVEDDIYTLGYLSALLDQKRKAETDFNRGKGVVKSASKGGVINAAQRRPETEAILKEMQRLIGKGQSINRAATLAYASGLGSSGQANKKLHDRHKKK